jgi:hypothetical protein
MQAQRDLVPARLGLLPDHAALLVALCCGAIAPFDLSPELAAIGIAVSVLLPCLAFWFAKRTLLVADPVIFLGFAWVVSVSLPILMPDFYYYPPREKVSSWAFDSAALWMFRGWAVMNLAYWATKVLFHSRRPLRPTLLMTAVGLRLRTFVGVIGLVGAALYIYFTGGQDYTNLDLGGRNSTLVEALSELQRFSILYVFLYFQARGRGALVPRDKVLLFLVLAGQAVLLSASATKLIGIQLIAAFTLGSAAGGLGRGRILRQLAVIAVGAILTYAVFSFITAYRIELRDRFVSLNAPLSEVIAEQVDSAESALAKLAGLKEIPPADREQYRSRILDRLNHVTNFAQLLNYAGPDSPYENAYASLFVPLYAVLPRDLMGSKVQFFGSGDFARLMGWPFGGWSISIPGSLFWAWGFEGIVPGMAALGLLLGLLSRGAERQGRFGLVCQLLQVQLAISLLDVGTEFQTVITTLTRSLIFFLAFLFLTSASRQHRLLPPRPAGNELPRGM